MRASRCWPRPHIAHLPQPLSADGLSWENGAILKLNYSNIKFYGQVEDASEHPAGAELNFLHLTLDTWRPFEKGFIFILFEAAFFLHII